MADIYKDFSFTRLAASIGATETSFDVDDTSLLPTNAALTGNDFFMAFESGVSYVNSYEVVRLVSHTALTLTVERGMSGSSASAHAAGALLKGVLTAGMLTRLRDLASPVRELATLTTPSLAVGAEHSGTIEMAPGYRLYEIETDVPARVRLYATAAQRDADAPRSVGTDPTGDHGLLLEYVTTSGLLSAALSPQVDGASLEATPTSDIPVLVANSSGAAAPVTLTLTYLRTE